MAKTKLVSKREEMRARRIVQRATDQQKESEVAEKRKLIGRCYKYPNRFSDGEPWWLYAIVTGVDDYGRLSAIQAQRDSRGTVSVEPDAYPGLLPQGGWIEIERHDFLRGVLELAGYFLGAIAQARAVGAVARGPRESTT